MNTITTPGGETLVILPVAEYEALVDALDVAEARRIRDTEEMLPADLVNAILDGEHPIRAWRKHRGLAAARLAEEVGISGAYLSEIESGKKEGSVSTLKAIAVALDVDLDDLV